jgi:diguanylate cyclase
MNSNSNGPPRKPRATPAAGAMANVAAFMQRMHIECTPANFELLFAVVSGQNENLRIEFGKLDRNIRQQDLDVLIRKHIPHHVEDDIAAESVDTVGDELHKFLDLVKSESTSLEKFDKVLKQQSEGLSNPKNLSPEGLKSTISSISAATEQKMAEGKKISEAVDEQVKRLDIVAADLNNYKTQKFIDPLTGLPNRRAFNKEILSVYQGERPRQCSVVMIDIDAHHKVKENLGTLIADKFIVHVATILKNYPSKNDYLARASDTKFAIIFDGVSEETVKSLSNKFRQTISKTPLLNATNGQPIGNITISVGICSSSSASGTGDILAKTEATLEQSKAKKGNIVTLFNEQRKTESQSLERNAWSLYEQESSPS